MKRSILFFGFLYLISIASVFAQKVDRFKFNLTVPGSLKDSLAIEQQKDVVYLTLSGVMNKDDFYFIRDSLTELYSLNLGKVDIDTIPEKAFTNCSFRCVFPPSVKTLGEQSLENANIYIVITGKFPNLSTSMWGKGYPDSHFEVSYDNPECKMIKQNIYSTDGKILYYYGGPSIIEEGTEIIEKCAFYKSGYVQMTLPSTLKLIKEYAFAYINPIMIMSSHDYEKDASITINAETPPVLEAHNFDEIDLDARFTIRDAILYVPKGKVDAYKKADPQWLEFKDIWEIGTRDPGSISNTHCQPFTIVYDCKKIRIESEQELSQVQIISLSGISCYDQEINSESLIISNKFPEGIYIMKVTLHNGISYSVKLNL